MVWQRTPHVCERHVEVILSHQLSKCNARSVNGDQFLHNPQQVQTITLCTVLLTFRQFFVPGLYDRFSVFSVVNKPQRKRLDTVLSVGKIR